MEIKIVKDDITKLDVEAIVNPANSYISMEGGLAGVIRKAGGEEIAEEARKRAPVKVGNAIITDAGNLPARFVIHAPTMDRPAQRIGKDNTRLAMQAVLVCAEREGIEEVAVPGLGTGVGGVSYKDAAEVMIETIQDFKEKRIRKIVLVALGEEFYQALKNALRSP